jgi:hypothetical protein
MTSTHASAVKLTAAQTEQLAHYAGRLAGTVSRSTDAPRNMGVTNRLTDAGLLEQVPGGFWHARQITREGLRALGGEWTVLVERADALDALPTDDEVEETVVAATVVEQDAPRQDLDGEFRYDEQGNARYWTPEEVAAERARAERAEQLADAIVERRPMLPGRDLVAEPLTGDEVLDVNAAVSLALLRLDPFAVAAAFADAEPGPEVDAPREQPEPLEWSSIARG